MNVSSRITLIFYWLLVFIILIRTYYDYQQYKSYDNFDDKKGRYRRRMKMEMSFSIVFLGIVLYSIYLSYFDTSPNNINDLNIFQMLLIVSIFTI